MRPYLLLFLSLVACGNDFDYEGRLLNFKLSDDYPKSLPPDYEGVERIVEIAANEYASNQRIDLVRLLALVRASGIIVTVRPEVWREPLFGGALVSGMFTPPHSITVALWPRYCPADNDTVVHEALHLFLWLDGDRDYGATHTEAGVWDGEDSISERAWLRARRELCPTEGF